MKIETFLAGIEMVQQQLRVKKEDRWSVEVCGLKFNSFISEFPEVNDAQFFWSCERWIQDYTKTEFTRMPTWQQLMCPLYCVENGRANRSWGFKRDLPAFVAPTPEQKGLLPEHPRSIAGVADPHNADAYQTFKSDLPALPSVTAATGDELTAAEWAAYLRGIAKQQRANGTTN